ncbi:MAG: hypothetical protein Ct9H300mP8_12940 [Gammaproteobacteria bacterium]|nr:MAG: hypothetical protein Ct9H300mP8_12940 [Gammaproteobacteria bacterium]
MRDTVENYVDGGATPPSFLATLHFGKSDSAKTIANDRLQIDIYDDPAYDPERAPNLSTMWSDPLVGRPESK